MINLPKEFYIPPKTEVIFVQDFFVKDLIGGAELTSDAIIKACPKKLFEIHAHSLTETLVKKHKDKLWVFGNQTMVESHILQLFIDLNITYFFFEYDFKPCVMRSIKKHGLQAGGCDCHNTPYGKFMANWMTHAKINFWCSDGQRKQFEILYPEFKDRTKNFTQSSTFYPETILNIRKVRERKERGEIEVLDRWLILDSDSWIKGKEDAVKYCEKYNLPYILVSGLTNDQFLEEMARSKGMVFFARDVDVGSRVLIECKLLGGIPIINEHVLPQFEPWYNSPLNEIEEYFLDGPERFWRVLQEKI